MESLALACVDGPARDRTESMLSHSSSSPIDTPHRSDTGASTPVLLCSASPCCSPALPHVLLRRWGCLRHRSLLPRAAPLAPLPASQISPLSPPKLFLLPPAASPACALRRHLLLVAPDAGGGTGKAAVSRAALAPPRVCVGLRAGRRLGRAPVRKGGGRGFHSPPRRTGYALRVPALQAPPHPPHQEAEQHDTDAVAHGDPRPAHVLPGVPSLCTSKSSYEKLFIHCATMKHIIYCSLIYCKLPNQLTATPGYQFDLHLHKPEQARSGTGDEKARSLVLLSSHRQQHEQGTSGDSTRAGDLRAATRAGDQ
ncbi:uncharacterized protein LOC125543897 isoform X1 [Triticum urartu]|nr:uncharacterized protein LOC125543897 isoform X1 [Triticum urartu]